MQVSPFNAIRVAVLKLRLPPVDPPAATGQLALVQEYEGRPESAIGRPRDVAEPQALVIRTPPRNIQGLLVPADEVRGPPQSLQILEVEPGLTIDGR